MALPVFFKILDLLNVISFIYVKQYSLSYLSTILVCFVFFFKEACKSLSTLTLQNLDSP